MGAALVGRYRGGPERTGMGGTVAPPRGYYAPTSYGGQQMAAQGSPDMLSQLNLMMNLGRMANAPQDQAITNNINSYLQELGLIGANVKTQTGYLNEDAGISRGRIGLNNEDLSVQRAALARQLGLLPQQHQLAVEGFGQREEEAKFGHERGMRQLSSEGTVAGNTVSQGHRQGINDLATQLMFQMRDIGRARKGEDLEHGERMAQIGDKQKQLDIAGKSLGLDSREVENRLQRSLAQLGLESAIKTQDIARAINDLNAGRYNPLQQLLGQIYQYSGIRPTA